MTYAHPWYKAQQKLASTTSSESQSELKQATVNRGPRLTDPSRCGDFYEILVVAEAMKRGAIVYKNVGCTGKTDLIIEKDGEKISVDVKSIRSKQAAADGVFLVVVDDRDDSVKWGTKRKRPSGWEDFWS